MTDRPIALLVTGSRSLARDPRKKAWARAILKATIAALRGATRAYLDARDRVDPAAERQARAELEKLL